MCGAATLPEPTAGAACRARCSTRRLMPTPASAGCDVAVVTTQPGSKSHENVQRKGFELLYTRAVLVRAPDRG